MSYGFTCWHCREQLNFDDLRVPRSLRPAPLWASLATKVATEAERRAGLLGWGIGHFDGQGHISCPSCVPAVYDFVRFEPHHERYMNLPREVIIDHGVPILSLGRLHSHEPIAFYEFWEALSDVFRSDRTARDAFLTALSEPRCTEPRC